MVKEIWITHARADQLDDAMDSFREAEVAMRSLNGTVFKVQKINLRAKCTMKREEKGA